MRACNVEGCGSNNYYARGLCRTHYDAWYRGNDLSIPIDEAVPFAPPRKYHFEAGQRFGRLVVIEEIIVPYPNKPTWSRRAWRLRCDCGNVIVRPVGDIAGDGGKTRSCGCLTRDMHAKGANHRHGYAKADGKSPEYRAWVGMKKRCYNPNDIRWENYGGRGVEVCDRWRYSFKNFIADMGPRPSPLHSLSRKDDVGNYEPGNVTWEIQDPAIPLQRGLIQKQYDERFEMAGGPALRRWMEMVKRPKSQEAAE